jgi:ankyrin repeat protein
LIAKGANPSLSNNAGQSILFIACWNDNESCVRMLLENSVDVNAAD